MNYLETRPVDQTDEYFGVKVPDPYNTPLNKAIERTADWMAFLVRELGMECSADVGRLKL